MNDEHLKDIPWVCYGSPFNGTPVPALLKIDRLYEFKNEANLNNTQLCYLFPVVILSGKYCDVIPSGAER